MLVVDEFDDGRPGVAVVDVVTESRRVDDGELDFELFLFQLSLNNLNLSQLVKLFVVSARVIFLGGKFGGEEGVNESSLAKSGFA